MQGKTKIRLKRIHEDYLVSEKGVAAWPRREETTHNKSCVRIGQVLFHVTETVYCFPLRV